MNSLILAVCFFFYHYFTHFSLKILFLICCFGYFRIRKLNYKLFCALLVLCSLSFFHQPIENTSEKGVIVERKANYALADFDGMKVMVMGEVYPKDQIQRINDFSEIHHLSNFNLFDASLYFKRRNITKMLRVSDYEIVERRNSLQKWWMNRISKMEEADQGLLMNIFYQQDTSAFSYMLFSAGLHYSSMLAFIRSHCKKKQAQIISIGILLLFGKLFGWQFSIQRLILHTCIAGISSLTPKDQCGLEMIALMAMYPSCVHESAFLLPFALRFFSLFNIAKIPRFLYSGLLVSMLQCVLTNRCNLVEILCFSVYRIINLCGFVIGFIAVSMPFFSFLFTPVNALFGLLAQMPSLVIEGHPTWWIMLIFFVYFVFLLEQINGRSIFVCLVCILLIPMQNRFNPFDEVVFINVGQGDCILIRKAFNQGNILMDIPSAYQKNIADEIVIPYLKSIGIHELDALILTHDDADHSGGKEDLMKGMNVKQIIDTPKDIQVKRLELLSLNANQSEDKNESSLVYFTQFGSLKYLFLADVPQKIEESLVQRYELNVDVVKIAHHGSNTSTSPYFIQNIQPQLAIISAGLNNRYQHPHPETMDTLQTYAVTSLNTATSGAISIKSFLNFHFFITSSKEFGIIRPK